jgi:ribonuclease Z
MMLASTTSLAIGGGEHQQQQRRLTLVGRSRAGDGTAFVIPELQWMLDCGALVHAPSGWKPTALFLSHTHADHVHCLTTYLAASLSITTTTTTINTGDENDVDKANTARRQQRQPRVTVYLPAKATPFVQRFLQAHEEMIDFDKLCSSSPSPGDIAATARTTDMPAEKLESQNENNGCTGSRGHQGNDNNNSTTTSGNIREYELRPTLPGETIVIHQQKGENRGSEYLVKTIECDHRMDCLGFSFFVKKSRLKPEHVGRSPLEIGRLRQEHGADHVLTFWLEPVLAYLGDTTHIVFERHVEILEQHKIIVVECTFIDDASVARAEATKHMHWSKLKPIVEAHPATLFVLIHFSLRYKSLDLQRFFRDESTSFRNVHPMLIEKDVEAEWKKEKGDGSGVDVADGPPTCNCFRCQPRVSA